MVLASFKLLLAFSVSDVIKRVKVTLNNAWKFEKKGTFVDPEVILCKANETLKSGSKPSAMSLVPARKQGS